MKHNKWLVIPGFVQNDLTQNVNMVHKKKFCRDFMTVQLLPMYRCKYISKADIESRGLYNFCEMLLVFDDPDMKGRIRNKWEFEILTNACFSALSHADGFMSVEQSTKSKPKK